LHHKRAPTLCSRPRVMALVRPLGLEQCVACAAAGVVCGAVAALWWVGREGGGHQRDGSGPVATRGVDAAVAAAASCDLTDLQPGKVYLVGAGPGGVGLITVRGLQLLRQAAVVVMDELADAELSALVKPGCKVHVVGKRGGKASSVPQPDINALLVKEALQGHSVVRLKGGDPLVFGRVYQEIVALREARVPFEIVPGVSSILAAPAAANLPVTDKELSKTFAVLSGHAPDDLDWGALARMDTLVILMGTRKLAVICAKLAEHGLPSATPVTIVSWSNTPRQRVVKGTIGACLLSAVWLHMSAVLPSAVYVRACVP